jgi:asparagine synthase (glutamine-hydrolysing)
MSATDLEDLPRALPAFAGLPGDWESLLRPAQAGSRLNSLLALDFISYLPGSVLTKVDRASMAHGLEVRPPFLDNEVIDWAFSLPARLKLRGGTGKYLLKKAVRAHLPPGIADRRKKGFAIPLVKWLKGPLRERVQQILRSSPLWDQRVLDRQCFATWADEHTSGRTDRSKSLWALIVLDNWSKRTGVIALEPAS